MSMPDSYGFLAPLERSRRGRTTERVERALKLVGFLKYRLFTQAEADDAPLLTMTLRLRDGTECIVSASRDTVWWRGKAHALRQRELFVNLTEGLFFTTN